MLAGTILCMDMQACRRSLANDSGWKCAPEDASGRQSIIVLSMEADSRQGTAGSAGTLGTEA